MKWVKVLDVPQSQKFLEKYRSECKMFYFLTVGINDFLDGWLDLISHMVNTKNVFETTHTLPTTSTLPDFIAFDATQYLARIHKVSNLSC